MRRFLEPSVRWSHPALLRGLLAVYLVTSALSVYVAGDWRDGDVSLYHVYALGFWDALRHPLLPTEYPPLSVLPFGLTLAGPVDWFPDVFAFWMGVLFVLGYLAFRRYAGSRQANAFAVYALAAGPATLLFRYDLLPALMTVAALWLVQRHRFAAAYPVLAAGILLKLFPFVILPVAAIAHWQARGGVKGVRMRAIALGIGGCLAIVVVVFAAAVIVNPKHGLEALTYNFQRPPEVESVQATLMWLGSLVGVPANAIASFGSYNLTGGLSAFVAAMGDAVLVAGLLWVYWRQLRGRFTVGQAAVAALLVVLCTSKVLSAQYLLWAVPLLATTLGFQVRWLFLCLLTALIFPTLFEVGITLHHHVSVTYSPLLFAGIAVRNALLLVLTTRFLWAPGVELPVQKRYPPRRGKRSEQRNDDQGDYQKQRRSRRPSRECNLRKAVRRPR